MARSMCIAAAVVFILTFSSIATAAEVSGVVTEVDASRGLLSLDNGMVFTLLTDRQAAAVSPGMPVTVYYTGRNGQKVAYEVKTAN